MRVKKVLFIVFFLVLSSQSGIAGKDLLFKSLSGNVFEPRIGSFYQMEEKKLRLDIGASFDIFSFLENEKEEYRLGVDFFTFTRLRTESNFKFPVETSDYFFGINHSAKTTIFGEEFFYRLRLAHISSHLVDGYSKNDIFKKPTFVYSREFATLTIAKYFLDGLRGYITLDYVFSMQPDDAEPMIAAIGFDYEKQFNGFLSLIAGYEFKMIGFDGTYFGNMSGQIGLLAKSFDFAGLFLGFYSYNGKSMHGMFYYEHDQYLGFGFQIYFF